MNNIKKKKFEKTTRTLILTLLMIETAYIVYDLKKPTAFQETRLSVEPGKNYSLLIDSERLPIEAHVGQDIRIQIMGSQEKVFDLPRRIIISQSEKQDAFSTVHENRFRFYYNNPTELRVLYIKEKLQELRRENEWDTVMAVLKRVQTDLKLGTPWIYPSQNAAEMLDTVRSSKEKVFCAQYCYMTVQFLQSLGFYARYVTIVGHEVCEVWLNHEKRWVCLDPMNGIYYVDEKGKKLSILEVAQSRGKQTIWAARLDGSKVAPSLDPYEKVWYWLCNDLVTRPVNIYDLNKYRVRAILHSEEVKELNYGDLYTLYPLELYNPPI